MDIKHKYKKRIVMMKKCSVEILGAVIVFTTIIITGVKLIDKDSGAASQILVATVSGYFGYVSAGSKSE